MADNRQKALAVISEVLGVDLARLEPTTHLVADLGIDSAKALHLLVELEDRLEVEISDDVVAEMKTVGDLLQAVDQYEGAAG